MSAYIKNIGREAKLLEDRQHTTTALRTALRQLQDLADPLEDPTSLDVGAILHLSSEVSVYHERLCEIDQTLVAVRKVLGKG